MNITSIFSATGIVGLCGIGIGFLLGYSAEHLHHTDDEVRTGTDDQKEPTPPTLIAIFQGKPQDGKKALFSCRMIAWLPQNQNGDTTFCLGGGDCVDVCPQDAIRIEDGHASIDGLYCCGCGRCADVCPRRLISMQPYLPDGTVPKQNK